MPHKFLSDNGKRFKAAAKFLDAVFKDETIQNHLVTQGSQWVSMLSVHPGGPGWRF